MVKRDLTKILKVDFNSNAAPKSFQYTFLIVYLLLQRKTEKEKGEMETKICIFRDGEVHTGTIRSKVSYADGAREWNPPSTQQKQLDTISSLMLLSAYLTQASVKNLKGDGWILPVHSNQTIPERLSDFDKGMIESIQFKGKFLVLVLYFVLTLPFQEISVTA